MASFSYLAMGSVLMMTDEKRGYTLTDRGTWLALKDKLDLEIVLEGDPSLFNPYGIIAVNPAPASFSGLPIKV